MEHKAQEDVLIRKAMRGNQKAFGELIRLYQEYLYKIAFGQVHQEQDALDAVQESIVKAYKNLKTLRDPALFRTWITRIVINASRDGLRSKKNSVPMEEIETLPDAERLSPEEKIDLYSALERLPKKYQTLVTMKYFEDMTIREISKAEKMPAGTVSVYLSRALKLMKADLEERKEPYLCEKL